MIKNAVHLDSRKSYQDCFNEQPTATRALTEGVRQCFYTLRQAAAELNIQYWLLLRAANLGLFPCYKFVNGRRRVLLSEVIAAIRATTTRPVVKPMEPSVALERARGPSPTRRQDKGGPHPTTRSAKETP
jgi:hypothetical protein